MAHGPRTKVLPPAQGGGSPAAPTGNDPQGVSPLNAQKPSAPETAMTASGAQLPSAGEEVFVGLDLGFGDLMSGYEPVAKSAEVPAAQKPKRSVNPHTALEAKRALALAGIETGRKIHIATPPDGWTVGLRGNQGELFCPSERFLLHTPTSHVPVAVVGEFANLPETDIPEVLKDLTQRGLIEQAGRMVKTTSKGEAVAASRLTEADETAATYAGHARLFAANTAMLTGGMEAREYAQTILDVVGRGTDEGRRLALVGVAALAASELVTRLEQGVARPEYLPEVVNHLRFSLRPEARPEAEPYLVMLRDAQVISDHFKRVAEKAPAEMVAWVVNPDAYRDAANRSLGHGTLKRLSMVSWRALEEMGEATGQRGVEIATAVLRGVSGKDEASVRSVGQLSSVLSPTIVVKAIAEQDSWERMTGLMAMSRSATKDLLSMLSRPLLYEMGGHQPQTMEKLCRFARQLGHELTPSETRAVKENVESIALHDGAYASYIAQLVAEGIDDPYLRPRVILEAAGHFAERNAEMALINKDQTRAEANIRIMAMLANGASVGDLERAYYAAYGLSEHPLETEEQRELAKVVAESLRATLVAVAGRSPNSDDGDDFLDSLYDAYADQPSQQVTVLRQILVGYGSVEEQPPYPSTFAQANLEAFVERTGLGDLRGIITLQALELAQRKQRREVERRTVTIEGNRAADAPKATRQAKVEKEDQEVVSLSAALANLMHLRESSGEPGILPFSGKGAMLVSEGPASPDSTYTEDQIVHWLRRGKSLDPNTEIVVVASLRGTKIGMFMPFVGIEVDRLAEIAQSTNPGACQVVYLGTAVDIAQAKVVRQALLERNLSVTATVIPDESISGCFRETQHVASPEPE